MGRLLGGGGGAKGMLPPPPLKLLGAGRAGSLPASFYACGIANLSEKSELEISRMNCIRIFSNL